MSCYKQILLYYSQSTAQVKLIGEQCMPQIKNDVYPSQIWVANEPHNQWARLQCYQQFVCLPEELDENYHDQKAIVCIILTIQV